MNATYPVHLSLTDRVVVVFGAGRVATRKIERLVVTGADLRVVAERASAPVRKLAEQGQLTLHLRRAEAGDVNGALLVLCATDDREVNAQMAHAARDQGCLVSRVDSPDDSDFTVPARARGGFADATISTNGKAPSASRRLGRELKNWVAKGPDRFVQAMAEARVTLMAREDGTERLRALAAGPLYEACCEGDEHRIQALMAETTGAAP